MLRAQIEWFKKQLFGGGKGERLDRAQLLLEIDTLEKLAARIEAPVQKVRDERSAPTRRPPANEAFAKLPVQETVVIVPEEVKAQPEAYEQISGGMNGTNSRSGPTGRETCLRVLLPLGDLCDWFEGSALP